MTPTKALSLLALLLFAGCGRGARDLVYIDIGSVRPIPVDAPDAPDVELDTVVVGGETLALPSLEASREQVALETEGIERALEQVRLNQERALRQLLDSFRTRNEAKIRTLQSEAQARLEARMESMEAETLGALRGVFEIYADQAGPLVHDLAWLAGVPDPDPRSLREPRRGVLGDAAHVERAQAAREALRKLDAEYERSVANALSRLYSDYVDLLASNDLLIESERERLAVQARREANEIAGATFSSIDLPELEPSALPGIEGAVATVPVAEPLPQSVPTRQDVRQALLSTRREAEIFADVHGYDLASEPGIGRDATQEFVEWRESFRRGR